MRLKLLICVCLVVLIGAAGCRRRQPPVARPTPPAPPPVADSTIPPDPPQPTREPVPPQPLPTDDVAGRSLEDLNKDSPLQPLFFELDSSDVSDAGRKVLQANAALLKKYASWVITIEGHCDERGTAEYNLALGERRAVAARTYLMSLGIDGNRLRTVSYGSEFPFDPAHQESAWSRNRRAHFVITAK
jgi:peptidoglycan-associated lipoprotein